MPNKKTIAIPTGGGDVPGLNPAIRAVTIRALREVVVGHKKAVDVAKHYNPKRLRPRYSSFSRQPIFIMTSDMTSDV